jgi:hypothetical protein
VALNVKAVAQNRTRSRDGRERRPGSGDGKKDVLLSVKANTQLHEAGEVGLAVDAPELRIGEGGIGSVKQSRIGEV